MSGVILVDFDGTLCEYYGWKHPNNGKPICTMVERVRQWRSEGKTVKIFTARVCQAAGPEEIAAQTKEVQEWCRQHIGEALPVTSEKDFSCVEIWDDRAVGVKINTGERVGQ